MADQNSVLTHMGENESLRAVLEDVLRDITNIMHAEVRLARTEIKDDLRSTGRVAGLFGAAGLCGLLGAASLVACLISGLALIMPVWLGALIAAVILGCMGGAFYAGGRARIREAKPPLEETRQEIKHEIRGDIEWVKQRIR
jgi:Putative Actinobacterial Holin-X, holin superfamily III